jgi:L-alanine-DL-glutamate epimerase-like enolase superfamily enzyme
MHHLLTEQVVTTPIELAGGRVAVPTAPGLGFELDLDAVERASERHERQGPYVAGERP